MIYFKDTEQHVYAYTKSNIEQVSRLTDLELSLSEKEPVFSHAYNALQQSSLELNESTELYDTALAAEEPENVMAELINKVNEKTEMYNEAFATFSKIESEYQPLKLEFDAIPFAFFDIRENLKVMKKMTAKEVEAHINPPTSKEQLIENAEQKKQLCADEAEKNITILERKVRLDMATDEEVALLKRWEIYSIKVSDIDTSNAPDIDWPEKP